MSAKGGPGRYRELLREGNADARRTLRLLTSFRTALDARGEMQEEADALLNESLLETGAPDPRPRYRILLSELKRQDPSAYDEAVSRFRDVVLPSIARRESEPLAAWLDYGRHLAEKLAPGRTLSLDERGRSSPLAGPASWKDLVVHVPTDPRARAILVGEPPKPTRAQRATVELLVNGRVMLGGGSVADAP